MGINTLAYAPIQGFICILILTHHMIDHWDVREQFRKCDNMKGTGTLKEFSSFCNNVN